MRYKFRKLLIFFDFHYGVWMEKHLSSEPGPRPAPAGSAGWAVLRSADVFTVMM